jgi:ribA/ribD-fused uncharacterized protein
VNEAHPYEIEQDRIRQYPILKKARGMREYKDHISHVANKIIIDNTAYGVEDFSKLPANLDPHYIATEERGDITFFYKCDSPLSNHHLCPVEYQGKHYNCSEQAFFATKAVLCDNLDALEDINKATNPKKQKSIGGSIVSNENWERVKVATMEEICTKKFNQNLDLQKFLLDTKDTYLCEDNPNCDFWGLGLSRNHPDSKNAKDMPGNQMGRILIRVRQSILDKMDQ